MHSCTHHGGVNSISVQSNQEDEDRAMGHRPLGSRAKRRESPPREYVDEEGVRYVPVRPRPPVTLLRHYRNPWKAAYHHFQRYSDIRIKEEKESLQEVANQRGVARRAQGWKMHLCVAQLMQLSNLEHDVYSRLTSLQEGLIPKKRAGVDDELHRINELIQGNIQRCKLVMDQVTEARDTMMKVLDHKDKVLKLLNQNGAVKKSNKLKRKDRA
uniref:histone deacetylase complex subunit SAP130-like isoform X1 n=1 Tax=Oncorhynchus gorbuscha TaxID=8017 RepID=UPI001EAF342A|nr:histone deacetylase complex subunit SAP130-like isoform X1 [Oncorhynchus gorbuscha]